jgi:Fe-S cluster assembly ATPase SufC
MVRSPFFVQNPARLHTIPIKTFFRADCNRARNTHKSHHKNLEEKSKIIPLKVAFL